MYRLNDQFRNSMLAATLLVFAGFLGRAQTTAPSAVADSPAPSLRSIEDMNYRGGDVAMPPFADSIIDVNSGFRRTLFSKGMALRVISLTQFVQNTLAAPVPADQQVYVGQGKTVWRNGASLTGSYSLPVHNGQFATIGLSYIRGQAITPHVSDALTFNATCLLFF